MSRDGIYLGKERTKRRRGVKVPEEALSTHVHIVGRSGMGKSWLLRQMIAIDIENNDRRRGPGLCLIDPAGDLYDFAFDVVSECKQARNRLYLIDLSQRDYFPGLNYLDQPGKKDPDSHARTIIEGIHKAFGHQEEATKVEVERYFKLLLVPFIIERLTFDEVELFIESEQFRNALLIKLWEEKKITPTVLAAWHGINRQPAREQTAYLRGILNRVIHFVSLATDSATSAIFSQDNTTVDFKRVMDESGIVLCKLPREVYDDTLINLIGIILVDKIMQAGYQRKPNVEPYFRVYIDEFARFVSNRDVEYGLNEMRKFHVSFVLAHQFLDQLRTNNPRLYKAVKTNCNVRILFSVDDEDAEVVAKSMFTEFLAEDQIQDEIKTQVITPVEEQRVVTSDAVAESFMRSLTDVSGGAETISDGRTHQAGAGQALHYAGDGSGNFTFIPDPTSIVQTTSDSTAFSTQTGKTNTWATAATEAYGRSCIVGRTVVPFLKPVISSQVTSRQFRQYQDKLAKLIYQIVSQDRRYAFIQVNRSVPVPFVTAEIEEPLWKHASRRIALKCAYKKNISGLPLPAIEAQREERKKRIAGIISDYGHQELPQLTTGGAVEADFEIVEEKPRRKPRVSVRKQSRKRKP